MLDDQHCKVYIVRYLVIRHLTLIIYKGVLGQNSRYTYI